MPCTGMRGYQLSLVHLKNDEDIFPQEVSSRVQLVPKWVCIIIFHHFHHFQAMSGWRHGGDRLLESDAGWRWFWPCSLWARWCLPGSGPAARDHYLWEWIGDEWRWMVKVIEGYWRLMVNNGKYNEYRLIQWIGLSETHSAELSGETFQLRKLMGNNCTATVPLASGSPWLGR